MPDRRLGQDIGWLLAIILVAMNLRAVVASVPPLAVDLASDLHLGGVATGALTTVPVVCMGLFAPAAAAASRRWHQSTVLTGGLILIMVGGGLRATGGITGLYLATALAGIGIAIVGTLLPGLVRAHAPDRVGPVTGLYTAALITGAFIASSLAEPARLWLGVSAQAGLAVWALPAVLGLAAWLLVPRRRSPRSDSGPTSGPSGRAVRVSAGVSPWRDRSAWVVTAFMAVQSLLFYASLAWLPVLAIEHGMSARDAGLLLGLFTVTQVVTAFLVPALAHRAGPDLRPWMVATLTTTTAGLLLVALVPYAFPGSIWLWAALQGLGMGGHFALALNTITQVAPSAAAVPAYSGMAFFFGYSIAAIGPVLLGFLADATGGFEVPFLTLTALAVVALLLGLAAATRARARTPAAQAATVPV